MFAFLSTFSSVIFKVHIHVFPSMKRLTHHVWKLTLGKGLTNADIEEITTNISPKPQSWRSSCFSTEEIGSNGNSTQAHVYNVVRWFIMETTWRSTDPQCFNIRQNIAKSKGFHLNPPKRWQTLCDLVSELTWQRLDLTLPHPIPRFSHKNKSKTFWAVVCKLSWKLYKRKTHKMPHQVQIYWINIGITFHNSLLAVVMAATTAEV